jgi:hypothetical protein
LPTGLPRRLGDVAEKPANPAELPDGDTPGRHARTNALARPTRSYCLLSPSVLAVLLDFPLTHTNPRPRRLRAPAGVLAALCIGMPLGVATAAGCAPVASPANTPSIPVVVPVEPAAVAAADVARWLDCPVEMGATLTQRIGIATGSGAQDRSTVVAGHCASGAGSPPTGVYLVAAAGSAPATLVPPAADLLVTSLVVAGGRLEMRAQGYSSSSIPRCCPDRLVSMAWVASGPNLERVSDESVASGQSTASATGSASG